MYTLDIFYIYIHMYVLVYYVMLSDMIYSICYILYNNVISYNIL